jgi:hypothetical protein
MAAKSYKRKSLVDTLANKLANSITVVSAVVGVIIGIQACGGANQQNATSPAPPSPPAKVTPNDPTPSPSPELRTYDIANAEVQDPAGCLNLQKLNERLSSVPKEAMVRHAVVDFRVAPGRGSGGERPTEKLIERLAGSSLQIGTDTLGTYLASLPKVAQNGCESVHFDGGDNGASEQKIVAWANNEITLEKDGEQQVFHLNGGRQILLTHKYAALDFCSNSGDKYDTQSTTSVRWDETQALKQIPETFPREFLLHLTQALVTVPSGITDEITANPDNASWEISASDLEKLSGADIRPELKRCHEPTPQPTPSPTPQVTPSPTPTLF